MFEAIYDDTAFYYMGADELPRRQQHMTNCTRKHCKATGAFSLCTTPNCPKQAEIESRHVQGIQQKHTFLDDLPKTKLSGKTAPYYRVVVLSSMTMDDRESYKAECNDLIEALNLNFAEGNILKALWRRAAARLDNGKEGNSALYDAEKIVTFGKRLIEQSK